MGKVLSSHAESPSAFNFLTLIKIKNMRKLSILLFTGLSVTTFAQFTSPRNGTTYTVEELRLAAPEMITKEGNNYFITKDVVISEGDGILFESSGIIAFSEGIVFTVNGTWTGDGEWILTAADKSKPYKGIKFDETATANIKNKIFEYGGGIQVRTGDFIMENSTVQYFKKGLVTGSAISFSAGAPTVRNSKFIENQLPAVSSGANQSVTLTFSDNYLFKNTQENSNRPQINMGPSGSGTTRIVNNEIIGDPAFSKVGGVSVSSLLGTRNDVEIRGNIIRDNRYGITVAGAASTGIIAENILTDNNADPNPLTGGSGISLSGGNSATPMAMRIEKNEIRGHLWGITLIGSVKADLGGGYLNSAGKNIFKENGNGGNVYALYNNTPNAISAKNNCWREGELSTDAMVEEVIFHQPDDAGLGLVGYSEYLCAAPLATQDVQSEKIRIYPNPSNGHFNLHSTADGTAAITDMSGRKIYSGKIQKGNNQIRLQAKPSVYLINVYTEKEKMQTKFIIK